MRRREFLEGSSTLLLGSALACADPTQAQTAPPARELKEELSAAEVETVSSSTMARDLDNYFGKGFS
jgi:hypothetical protein